MNATVLSLSFSSSFRLNDHQVGLSSPQSVSTPRAISSPTTQTRVSAVCASSPTSFVREKRSSSPVTLYDLLEVDVGATGREIKAAYRKRVKECHPDVVSVYQKDSSADHFMEVHEAYCALSDPVKRADYDQSLLALPNTRPQSTQFYYKSTDYSSFSKYPMASGFKRNWETDQCW